MSNAGSNASRRKRTFDGLAGGLEWLVERRPKEASRRSICHGDLWAGNILADGDRLTGVIDYTVATIAEPALEVGFTAMGLSLAPIDAPDRSKGRGPHRRSLCNRYVAG